MDKLPDSEIVKALECCISSYNKKCDMCPYEKHKPTVFWKTLCSEYVRQDIFDLINRLQEKNSNLTSDLTSLRKDFSSLKAENERLKGISDNKTKDLLRYNASIEELHKKLQTAKSEAYKEFAELLKNDWIGNLYYCEDLDITDWIDNLLKETVGE